MTKSLSKIFVITLLPIIFGVALFAKPIFAEDIKEIKAEKKVSAFATMKLSKIQASLDAFRIDTHKKLVDKKTELVAKKNDPANKDKISQIKYALLVLLFTLFIYLFSTLTIFYISLGVAIFLVFSFVWRNLL